MKHFSNNAKEYLKMTKEDIEFRQGRSKRQADNNEKLAFISTMGLFIVILGILLSGLFTQ